MLRLLVKVREVFPDARFSSIEKTEAIGPPGQPDFLNGAFLFKTELTLQVVRQWLRSLEEELGRVRTDDKFAPRTMDLDVLLWNGALDVAWFLGGCLRLQDLDQEKALLRRYYEALTGQGVEGYAWAQCAHDYRCAMLSCFVQGILSAVPPETGDAYAHDLAGAIGERFVTVPGRLSLHEVMPV